MAEKNINTNNEEQFDTEMQVNLNLDQLSYICEYCGKVNSISASHCIRCGKRRPRNEYVAAMSKIKNAKSIKAEYIDEQAKIETDKKEVANLQLVRLVENRVADETAQIKAQETIKLDQDREAIRKMTAREAVLRIIAAENAAEDRIIAAERKAEQVVKGRNAEIEAVIIEERERTLKTAAQKLVVERAGIEEAAREKIESTRKQAHRATRDGVEEAREQAEKNAARRAVLQIIASEKANEDMLRMSKNALQQAALERIEEERKLTEKEYYARFAAEKFAIEKAADERIRAEKEALRKVLEDKDRNAYMPNYGYSQNQQGGGATHTVQPISIVPYLNPNQPVNQYNPNRKVYKFIPNNTVNQVLDSYQIDGKQNKKTKPLKIKKQALNCKKITRITAGTTLVLAIIVLVMGIVLELINQKLAYMPLLSEKVLVGSNASILYAFGEYMIQGINKIFGASIIVPAAMAGGEYFTSTMALTSAVKIMIPIGFTFFMVFDIILIVQCVIRLITGRAKKLGFIVALLQVISIILAVVGAIIVSTKLDAPIENALLTVGVIAFTVIAIVNLVLTMIGAKNKKSDNLLLIDEK